VDSNDEAKTVDARDIDEEYMIEGGVGGNEGPNKRFQRFWKCQDYVGWDIRWSCHTDLAHEMYVTTAI